jgi:crotonobetainyl-CoA:carnitine CoA-transferase CaiB-like acyl-CoA transferase
MPWLAARQALGNAWQCAGTSPLLGQHTDQVLREYLGMNEAEITALRQAGAIGNKRSVHAGG